MPWSKTRPVPTAKAAARGYGGDHKKLRKALLPQAYGIPCYRCGQLMLEGQALHLDHTDDRAGYGGFSHADCNVKAAARKGRRLQGKGKRRRSTLPTDDRLRVFDTSRQW
jgi:hypothetical protein